MTEPARVWMRCHNHGPRAYTFDPSTSRFRCPVDDCPAFIDAELVERKRAADAARPTGVPVDPWHDPTAPPMVPPW